MLFESLWVYLRSVFVKIFQDVKFSLKVFRLLLELVLDPGVVDCLHFVSSRGLTELNRVTDLKRLCYQTYKRLIVYECLRFRVQVN